MSPPGASACRTATCSSAPFPFHRRITCTSLCSSSVPLFESLCLSDSVFIRIHPCFSCQGSPDDLSDSSLCGIVAFHATQALRILGPQTRRTIFWVHSASLFQPRSLAMRSFFVSCDFVRQLQFWSHHLPRSASQNFPIRRFPSITQCLSCPTFASHNSILGSTQNCSCSTMMTNEDSLGHAACK